MNLILEFTSIIGICGLFAFSSDRNVAKNIILATFAWLTVSLVGITSENLKLLLLTVVLFSIIFLRIRTYRVNYSAKRHVTVVSLLLFGFAGLNLVQKLIEQNVVAALTFLGLGFDNAGHIRIFAFRIPTHGNVMLNDYPGGQSSVWYFFAKFAHLDISNQISYLAAFATLALLTYLSLCFAAYIFVNANGITNELKSAFLIGVIFVFGGITYIFVSGYHPYIFAALVILISMVALEGSKTELESTLILFMSTLILVLTCPPLAFALFPVFLTSCFRVAKKLSVNKLNVNQKVTYLLGSLLTLISAYFIFRTLQIFNWKIILDLGGIEPLNENFLILSLILITFFYTLIFRSSQKILNTSTEIVLWLILSSIFISALTIMYNGSITYYAIKQFHIAFLLTATLFIAFWIQTKNRKFRLLHLFVALSFVLLQTFPTFRPSVFTTPFMGSGKKAIELMLSHRETWRNQVIDSKVIIDATKIIDLKPDECAVIWSTMQDSELASRWLNEMYPNQVSECWYLNAGPRPRTHEEMLVTMTNPMFKVVLVTSGVNLTPEELVALTNSEDRIVSLQ